jgi:hypothetical protein
MAETAVRCGLLPARVASSGLPVFGGSRGPGLNTRGHQTGKCAQRHHGAGPVKPAPGDPHPHMPDRLRWVTMPLALNPLRMQGRTYTPTGVPYRRTPSASVDATRGHHLHAGSILHATDCPGLV